MLLFLVPPVIPISVCAASPGPLTTHPMIERVIGALMWDSFSSKILTVSITWKPCLAHEGQDIILTPLFLRFNDFNISLPIFISSTGSSESETLMVSPMPSSYKFPKPIEDFILPGMKLPASVIPKWSG